MGAGTASKVMESTDSLSVPLLQCTDGPDGWRTVAAWVETLSRTNRKKIWVYWPVLKHGNTVTSLVWLWLRLTSLGWNVATRRPHGGQLYRSAWVIRLCGKLESTFRTERTSCQLLLAACRGGLLALKQSQKDAEKQTTDKHTPKVV